MINELFLELNEDFTIKSQSQDAITPYSNGKVKLKVWSKAPSTDAISVGYKLVNGIIVDDEMIFLTATNIDGNGTNQWEGFVQSHVLGGAAQDGNRDFKLRVIDNDIANPVINQEAGFTVKIGVVNVPSDLAALSPTLNESYATVLFEEDGITPNGNIWQYRDTDLDDVPITPAWLDSGLKEILQFKNAIVAEYQIEEGWEPSTAPIDPTATQNILDYLATLGGKIAALEDEQNDHVKVREDLIANYPQKSVLDAKDVLYVQDDVTGLPKRSTVGDIVESGRVIFIDTFAIASGLSCPDATDLLCVWPDGIADPNVRFGWVASVLSTGTTWSWSVPSNAWVDTGLAPTTSNDVGHDSSSDPTTNANNVKDALDDHGNIIKVEEDKMVVVENKTQNLDEGGNIAEVVAVAPSKDIVSPDLGTATGISGIIANILAHFIRIGDNETNISTNTDDILLKLQKDFSTLGSIVLDGDDLFVIQDDSDGLNKKVTLTELTAKIEGLISNDQGFYIDMTALRAAKPVGQAGWFATIGGSADTMALWDVEGADWIEVASKLYYSVSAGLALEGRMTAVEASIVTINAALLTKEEFINKLSTKVGNEGSILYYLNIAGIEAYVEPIRIQNEEDRTYTPMIQQVGTTKFQTNLNDSELYDGRIFYGKVPTIVIQAGIVQISIDGGSTFKNLTATVIVGGDPVYVDFDLTINNVFGTYIQIVFNTTIDKWIIFNTNENLVRIVGSGWTLDTTLMGLKAIVDSNTARISNTEVQNKPSALQKLAKTPTGSLPQTGVGSVKLDFDIIEEASQEQSILSVDVNNDHLLVIKREPGVQILMNVRSTHTGAGAATITSYYPTICINIDAVDIEVGKQYRIQQVGTTDFTTIGATSNTLGEIFVATGSDAGTGLVQLVLGEVSITLAAGESLERSKTFYAFATDYVDNTVICVYYTIIGNTASLEVTDNYCETKYSAGQAPADETTTTIAPESSRSGVETKQKGHNLESVADRKHLLAVNRVTVANYVSGGKYVANTDIDLSIVTNTTVRVLLSGNGADFSELASLSIDNDANAYPIEYRETSKGITVQNAITHVMDLYFTGTTFLATYVDSSITQLQTIEERIGSSFGIEGIIDGTPTMELEGATANQLLINGNATASLVGDGSGTQFNIQADGTFAFNNSYDGAGFTFSAITGHKYYIKIGFKDGTHIYLSNSILIQYSDGTNTSIGTGADLTTPINSGIITATKTLLANVKFQESVATSGTFDKDEVVGVTIIDITDTIYDGKTADELNNTFTKYFEGYEDVVNPAVLMRSTQLFDKETATLDSYINSSGVVTASGSGNFATDFIEVIAGTDYYLSGLTYIQGAAAYIAYYDASQNFISGEALSPGAATTGNGVYSIPENAVYTRFTGNIIDIDVAMLNEGTAALPHGKYDQALITFFEIFRSVGLVRDKLFVKFNEWFKGENVGKDEVILAEQTYSLSGTTGLTYQRFFLANVDVLLPDLKLPTASESPIAEMKIGNVPYNPIDLNSISSQANIDANPFTFGFVDTGTMYIISDEADATAFNAIVLANGITLYYENGETVDIPVKVTGSMIQEEVTTISQSQTIPAKLDIVYTVDSKRQIEVNVAKVNNALIRIGDVENTVLYETATPGMTVEDDSFVLRTNLPADSFIEIIFSTDAGGVNKVRAEGSWVGNNGSLRGFLEGDDTIITTYVVNGLLTSSNTIQLIDIIKDENGTLTGGQDIYVWKISVVGGN